MKKALVVVAVAIVTLVGIWLLAPNDSANSENTSNQSIQLSAIASTAKNASIKAGQEQAYLLDVRTPEEYGSGHATNATNHDVELLKASNYPDMPKDSEIYVYCRSGNRSAQATQILKDNGYTNVTDLGGLDTIQEAGLL